MKKILLILFLMMALSFTVCAQDKAKAFARTGKNSFRAGLSYLRIDMPELEGGMLLYHQYSRNLVRRINIAATISNTYGSTSKGIPTMEGLIFGDLSLYLNLLELRRHTFKVGAGFSLVRFSELRYHAAPFLNPQNELQYYRYSKKWTTGNQLIVEYEFNVYKRLFLGVRGINYTYNGGYGAFGLGINGGIRF